MSNAGEPASLPDYDRYYGQGTWHWNYATPWARFREWAWVRRHLLHRFRIPRGSRVLEVACGQGFHVDLFARLGMRVTGVDVSVEGVRFARSRFPEREFIHCDAAGDMPFERDSFDVIWSRGAGFFHYDVTDEMARRIVAGHLRYLKPGGLYIVVIATDLSGHKPVPIFTGEWHNTLEDYAALVGGFGMPYTVAWEPERRWLPLVGPKLPNGFAIASLRKTPNGA